MKRGLNYQDVNTMKYGLSAGWTVEDIARSCKTFPEVIQKYMDSMPPEEIQALKDAAPADAVDMAVLKAQLKAEILAEMREEMHSGPALDADQYELAGTADEIDDRSPQQKSADTRKANREAEEREQEEAQGQGQEDAA